MLELNIPDGAALADELDEVDTNEALGLMTHNYCNGDG
jgi:hypothetical protein